MLAIAGCGGRASVNQASAPPCETRVPAAHPTDTVTVVVFNEINPLHAPVPQNRDEQFVFSHLYETLVTIDCHGVVQPGLAKSWKPGSDGWLVELRDGAQYWDQTKVAAEDIVRSFEPAIRAGVAITSVDVVDDHTVLIKGDHGPPDIKLLALPMVAIRNEWGVTGPAIGTGPWQFNTHIPFAEAVAIEPVVGSLGPVVRFVQASPSDAKDLIAGKADAMITDDPAGIDYAKAKAKVAMVPLTWDKAYVLVDPVRLTTIPTGSVWPEIPAEVRDALARDAVPVDSRAWSSILERSWTVAPSRTRRFNLTSASATNQVVFAAGDPTARSLAERIVALVAMDTTTSWEARRVRRALPGTPAGSKAIALRPNQFAERLQTSAGNTTFIISLSWNADFPLVASRYQQYAPWLVDLPPASDALLPLVETRPHFIAMSDRIGFAHDEIGNVRILISQPERAR